MRLLYHKKRINSTRLMEFIFKKATVIALAKIPILIEIRYHAKNGFEWYAFKKLERNVTNQSENLKIFTEW